MVGLAVLSFALVPVAALLLFPVIDGDDVSNRALVSFIISFTMTSALAGNGMYILAL